MKEIKEDRVIEASSSKAVKDGGLRQGWEWGGWGVEDSK